MPIPHWWREKIVVYYYYYLGLQVAADGGCEMDVVHTMNEGHRVWGALKSAEQ